MISSNKNFVTQKLKIYKFMIKFENNPRGDCKNDIVKSIFQIYIA